MLMIYAKMDRPTISELLFSGFHDRPRLAHQLPGVPVLFFGFLHENLRKGVLLYQTIRVKVIFFSLIVKNLQP